MEADSRFVTLYEEGFASVYKAALLLGGDPPLAEDATQEAFARALERWERLGDKPWVLGWVMTTALNLVRRRNRWRIHRYTTRESEQGDIERSLDLRGAIRSLPRRQREAVTLHHIADLPVRDVAKVMGCREGTVKAHLFRAREHLARALRRYEDA